MNYKVEQAKIASITIPVTTKSVTTTITKIINNGNKAVKKLKKWLKWKMVRKH